MTLFPMSMREGINLTTHRTSLSVGIYTMSQEIKEAIIQDKLSKLTKQGLYTKGGLLYIKGRDRWLSVREADEVAHTNGFLYAENLVTFLKENNIT